MYSLNSNQTSDSENSIFKGVIGLTIELTVYEKNVTKDISTASTVKFIFKKPDGTILEKEGVFVTDGKDGRVYYKTGIGDIDTVGKWEVQVYFVLGTFQGYSTISKFTVNDTLKN